MLSDFFIRRPVFAGVVAIVMVLAGALALPLLPVEQYPAIAPPTVQVSTRYPGASARTVAETVATVIEQEVNGVEGMLYMTSISADDGSYTLTVTFGLDTDLDLAAVRVQNNVAVAEARLPAQVREQGVTTRKRSTSLLMVIAPNSPDGRYDQLFLSNYASINMRDALARVPGVGQVTVFGAKDFSMRVWLDPEKMAARELTTDDVVSALREQNVQVAAGRLGAEPTDVTAGFQLTLRAKGRLETAEEFARIILRALPDGRILRLGDVARLELGAQSYDQFGRFNGRPAPVIGIFQLPGSNALDVADGIRAALDDLRRDFPPGLEAPVFFDFTRFVAASIDEVVVTLLVAAGLVFLTVFVFLQDWRATLIPGVAIPVSLVGTLAVLLAVGLSLNMLTMFALVLAIGIVVDDAIVVVENTARLVDEGELGPREAAHESMRQITGPVVATTLVLLAVFVPTALLPGVTGEMYRQFGITLSVAMVISAVNALTLSPALCALLLRRSEKRPWLPFRLFNRAFEGARSSYAWAVRLALRTTVATVVLFVAVLAATGGLSAAVPRGFIPSEDQSYLFVNVTLPDAAKLARTDAVLRKAERMALDTPGVAGVVTIGGVSLLTNAGESNSGTLVVILEPWRERTTEATSLGGIVGALSRRFDSIREGRVFPFVPPAIQGLGRAGGFEMQVQDRAGAGYEALQNAAQEVMAQASGSSRLQGVFTSFSATVPQMFVDVDRTKVRRRGIPLGVVFDTLATQLGSTYVNDFNIFGRVYQVRVQADHRFRQDPADLLRLEVRNDEGRRVPLSAVADVRPVAGPSTVYRHNLYPAASITGSGAPGVSSGQAMDAMRRIADRALPPGFGYEWTGLSFQERAAGNMAPLAFALAVVFAFLFLAAQYESWISPLAILATVPIGALGALLLTWILGHDNNVYTQIGLVLLIAMVCKNAILIVEFAEQRRRHDLPLADAALEAARLRFRPILMTSIAFVLGTLPLLFATGAGATSRRAIGTAVFGGMVLATTIGVFFIPTMYAAIRKFLRPARGG